MSDFDASAPVTYPQSFTAPQERSRLETRRSESTPADASGKTASRSSSGPNGDFTGSPTNLQVKVPIDLVQSLKLMAIQQNRSMSEIVFECLTTESVVTKCWIATRRAG